VQLTPGKRTTLNTAKLVGDCASFTMQVGTSDYQGGPVTWSAASTPYAGSASSPATNICGFGRGLSGLFHRFRVNIAAGATWTIVSGVEVIDAPVGGDR
jgi:hypothetical protein